MEREQAINLMLYIENAYSTEFDKDKAEMWLAELTKHGDYNESMKKVKERVIKGNPYKPNLAEVLETGVKRLETTQEEQERQDKIKRFEEDKNYREQVLNERKEVRVKYQDLMDKLTEGNDDEF